MGSESGSGSGRASAPGLDQDQGQEGEGEREGEGEGEGKGEGWGQGQGQGQGEAWGAAPGRSSRSRRASRRSGRRGSRRRRRRIARPAGASNLRGITTGRGAHGTPEAGTRAQYVQARQYPVPTVRGALRASRPAPPVRTLRGRLVRSLYVPSPQAPGRTCQLGVQPKPWAGALLVSAPSAWQS